MTFQQIIMLLSCLLLGVILYSSQVYAGVSRIEYIRHDTTALNESYSIYRVVCGDNSRREITGWNSNTLWCVGLAKGKSCGPAQLEIAEKACQSTSTGLLKAIKIFDFPTLLC